MAAVDFRDLLAAAGDAGYSLLPNGPYDVKVFAVEAKKTGKGKDMFAVQYEITSGPHMGRKVKNNMTISPDSPMALGFFFREMKAMGLSIEFFQTNPTPQAVAATLIGRVCRIEIGKGSFNDEERDEVKRIMPPVGGVASPPPVAAAPQPKAQPKAQPVSQTPPPAPANLPAEDAAPAVSEYLSADPNAPELPY